MRRAALIALPCLVLAGCWGEEWRGVVYPNRDDLTKYREIGNFDSLEECRAAALSAIEAKGWGGRADYECGLDCEARLGAGGPLVCEKTSQ